MTNPKSDSEQNRSEALNTAWDNQVDMHRHDKMYIHFFFEHERIIAQLKKENEELKKKIEELNFELSSKKFIPILAASTGIFIFVFGFGTVMDADVKYLYPLCLSIFIVTFAPSLLNNLKKYFSNLGQ